MNHCKQISAHTQKMMHNVLSLEEGCGDAHQQEYLLRTLNKNLDMSFIKPEILRFLFANISNENYMLQQ